jgi:hypothetical protein
MYKNNEIFVDVVEEVNLLMSNTGGNEKVWMDFASAVCLDGWARM